MKTITCYITDIEWDIENQEFTDLPSEVGPVKIKVNDFQPIDEQIGDYLSNKYSWCVLGFQYEIVKESK